MKSYRFRFLALFIAIAQLLSLSTVIAFASSNDGTAKQSETMPSTEGISLDNKLLTEAPISTPERKLTPIIHSDKLLANEKIELSLSMSPQANKIGGQTSCQHIDFL